MGAPPGAPSFLAELIAYMDFVFLIITASGQRIYFYDEMLKDFCADAEHRLQRCRRGKY
jgi:hypothetical protein